MASLPPEQKASYGVIIDDILASADLNTISAKAIRKALQERVHDDLTPQKKDINDLIIERFDKIQREQGHEPTDTVPEPAPTVNGASHVHLDGVAQDEAETGVNGKDDGDVARQPTSNKRKAEDNQKDDEADDMSDVKDTPPAKKPKKSSSSSSAKTDEEIAREIQAELNASSARATRGGGSNKKKHAAKRGDKKMTKSKSKSPKKKSAAKLSAADDSELDDDHDHDDDDGDGGGEKPEREKKGGFHKPMNLSQPLVEMLGETQLSRPQTVKRIWAYVKQRELQDPSDKRQIRCDEAMRAVFKSDKIHMFTMNKVLATQLYPVDE